MSPILYRRAAPVARTSAVGTSPAGCSVFEAPDGLRFVATCRHAVAIYYVLFMSFVSVVIGGVLLGPFFHGQTPNLVAALIGSFFLMFVLPFWCVTLCYIVGRSEVLLTGDELRVFTGVGPLGRTQRLLLRDIAAVETPERPSVRNSMYSSGGFRVRLQPAGAAEPCVVYFGRMLTEARRNWLASQLAAHGVQVEGGRR